MANTAEIEKEISDIVIELYDTVALIQASNDEAFLQQYIDSYIKRVTRIGLRLAKADYVALQNACILFHDVLEHVKSSGKLSDEQLEQFEVWPGLILACIEEPGNTHSSDLLITLLQNPVWNYRIKDEDIERLRLEFAEDANRLTPHTEDAETLPVAENKTDIEEDVDTAPFDGDLFQSVQEEIVDAMSALISDLSSVDEDDDFGLSHAFYLCADRIELLGMSIATAGLMGLMDVCMIFQNGLRELARREKMLTEDEMILIEEFTAHLISYLATPDNDTVVDQLVEYLNKLPWLDEISEDEMATLKAMLIPENIELVAPEEMDFEEELAMADNVPADITAAPEAELEYSADVDEQLVQIEQDDEDQYFLGKELIQLIHDEFQLEQPSLEEITSHLSADKSLDENDIEYLLQFKTMIERFALATESVGLTGLNRLLQHLLNNMSAITDKDSKIRTLTPHIVETLQQFPATALLYLGDLENREIVSLMTSAFYTDDWPVSADIKQAELEDELHAPQITIEDDIEIRATQATVDDVSLKLPEDVNQQLLTTLLQELPVQTEEFTQAITAIVEGNATMQDVEKAQRIAHTLKGAANTVGVAGIANLTHHIEDIFDAFTSQQRLPGKNLAEVLMNAADVLEMMSESLLGIGEAPEQAQSVLQQVLDWANLIDQDGIPEDDVQLEASKVETTTAETTEPAAEINAETMLRIPASLMDELLRIAGESIILGGQLQERLRKATEQTRLAHEQNALFKQLVSDLEQLVDVQGLTAGNTNSQMNEVFDSLELEQYNELHTITHRLVEAATDAKELTNNIEDELNVLDTLMVDQSRLHKQNQNIVMQTRMVPVQNIVPRLQRGVRQTARTTCKKVNLDVSGTDTLMDSDVLDELIDPLMHILRNAVDHGIENEVGREKKGKDITGNIRLSFNRDGDHIVVRCEDDGAGLDLDSIRESAISRKLITESDNLSDEELINLIWIAGFSTRETTTQVSGRGIGMDAVYNQITTMKGTINIETEKDKGCVVELRLPLTLISVHAILVRSRKQVIAVSNRGIEQILSGTEGEFIREDNSYLFRHGEETYPAFDIETLLHQSRQAGTDNERTVFIIHDEKGKKYAISVEQIIANQDLIVKQLGSFLPDIAGIEGATILGDGSIAPVLDLAGLIRTVADRDIAELIREQQVDNLPVEETIHALVIDDSLSARRALAEFVKDMGYDVSQAKDGIEALEVMEEKTPDIILVDLEMPRMNGLEFTQHIRSKASTQDIPVIMITSRSTAKHREMADHAGVNIYMTKPFSEDDLLEQIQSLLLIA